MKYPFDLRPQDEGMYRRGWNAAIDAAAKIAENPGFIQAQDTDWDLGVNYAKRFIANAIRAHGDKVP